MGAICVCCKDNSQNKDNEVEIEYVEVKEEKRNKRHIHIPEDLIHVEDEDKIRAFMLIEEGNVEEFVDLLEQSRIHLQLQNDVGETFLHFAVKIGADEAIKQLGYYFGNTKHIDVN